MINRIIIFLIRHKLGVGKYEDFRFTNQNQDNHDVYFFAYDKLIKMSGNGRLKSSGVSLNHLLSSDCHIEKC